MMRSPRPPARVVLLTAAATGVMATSTGAAAARTPPPVRPAQELATLLAPHAVFSNIGVRRARRSTLPATRPITGGATVVPVVRRFTTPDGVAWLRVRLPGRPNGSEGWIEQRGTVSSSTSWHVVVTTSTRRVIAYRAGRVVRSFTAIVGKPATPTPLGRFFVEESVDMRPNSAGAPFALALSARSEVLQEFEGGPGQTAIHGVRNLTGTLGTAASHGCVRLSDRAIGWLATKIGAGAPVTIRR